jgi:intracellular septation protein A
MVAPDRFFRGFPALRHLLGYGRPDAGLYSGPVRASDARRTVQARFIQWKPTVLLALTAAAFLGSSIIGRQPLARRMLEGVFNEPLEVSAGSWLIINLAWVAWFAALAAANIYIAQNYSEAIWVKFKVFGITAAMLVFMIPQVIWLNRKIKPAQSDAAPP